MDLTSARRASAFLSLVGLAVPAAACSSNAGSRPGSSVDAGGADATTDVTPADDAATASDAGDASSDAAATADSGILDPSTVDAGMGGPPPALTADVTIHVAGDSTAAIFPSTDPRVGWAAVLQPFFGTGVTIDDAAVSGASSKSFYDQGYWASLVSRIQPGDYVFIEFAHNDEKNDDLTRYTDPATSYPWYLKTFIGGARARGAYVVLLTSICRRYFSGANAIGTHGAYTTALIGVGMQTNAPVIDMETKTLDWLTLLGPVNSVPMFAPADDTHLSALGAPQVAELAVQGITELALPIATRLDPGYSVPLGPVFPDGGADAASDAASDGSPGGDAAPAEDAATE
jgi:lysophospholipase L1-like esterase